MVRLGEDGMWDGRSKAGSLFSIFSFNFLSGFEKRMTASFVSQLQVSVGFGDLVRPNVFMGSFISLSKDGLRKPKI